ncbi:MAG: 4-oxalomesaconate tautomerase [Rhizobiales bacterium]|nr:4-oxalomesaconate tautomerase [Hyphomicrobiales bacterium]
MPRSVRCMWMRGGTSKAAYFLAQDLPADPRQRDQFLLRIMGSPDDNQIDGIGGANPLSSKVAVVKKSSRYGIDVDYLFLQVLIDKAIVTSTLSCGDILAGVGPFAIERGLVTAHEGETSVAIYLENSGQVAIEKIATNSGKVIYTGAAKISGVPRTASPIPIDFKANAGGSYEAFLPTGNEVDVIDDITVTCIDNGLPCVVMLAKDFGITGAETSEQLTKNDDLLTKLDSISSQAGKLMNVANIADEALPHIILVGPASHGGAISTRTFIAGKCHASIDIFAALSLATSCFLPQSPAYNVANLAGNVGTSKVVAIEHPDGIMSVNLSFDASGQVNNASIVRTARKLFDGQIFA